VSPATAEVDVSSTPLGLPLPPPEGTSALAPGTFSETVVLVTGGGTGLGAAIAEEFARLDASIAVVSRNQTHLDAANATLAKYEKPFISWPCDIRDPEQVQEAFDVIERRLGLPDVLVNNAAANFPVCAEDLSPNGWRTVVDITLNGTFYMTREFGRRHLALKRAGSIVCIGASYAWTGGPGFVHSAAAKAGVKNLVETLAVEWGPFGIQINGLVPGLVPHADMSRDIRANLGDDDDRRQPAMRVGQRREIGWAATFLASPFARFISGHTLVVDGANWQRRELTNLPVATIRDQMGRRSIEP
jgi:NAD(P)-dependent dehydrogenase (short-subunit alcohol dehydrogenase family)